MTVMSFLFNHFQRKAASVDCRCGLKAEVVEILPGIWHVVCQCGKATKECASENDAKKEWMK